MALDAFTAPGRFYRGNLHTHSTLSDGALEPEEVCRRYKAEGYDFISLTDHFVGLFDYPIADTRAFRDADFTTIPGAELHSGAMETGEIWHVLAVGLPDGFAPSNTPDFAARADQETGPDIAQRARDAGAFVVLAHPHWSMMSQADARSLTAAHAVEVYNHGCYVDCDRGEGFHTADQLLAEGRKLTLVATDDAHFSTPDAFGGWVMVKAEKNEPDALVSALKNGHFYASQGPELHNIELVDETVNIASSAVETVILQGEGAATSSVRGASMTRSQLQLNRLKNSRWIRVTVVDRAGRRAWSNPIWRD